MSSSWLIFYNLKSVPKKNVILVLNKHAPETSKGNKPDR